MTKAPEPHSRDRDTLRAEYDFSGAVRGATARRYAEGASVVAPDLDDGRDARSDDDPRRAPAPMRLVRRILRRRP